MLGRLVGRVFVNVPAAEDQIVQSGERDKVLDQRRAPVGAFPQPDGGKLGERTDRRGNSSLHGLHAGHERGGNGADSRNQDAQFSVGGRNLNAISLRRFLRRQFWGWQCCSAPRFSPPSRAGTTT